MHRHHGRRCRLPPLPRAVQDAPLCPRPQHLDLPLIRLKPELFPRELDDVPAIAHLCLRLSRIVTTHIESPPHGHPSTPPPAGCGMNSNKIRVNSLVTGATILPYRRVIPCSLKYVERNPIRSRVVYRRLQGWCRETDESHLFFEERIGNQRIRRSLGQASDHGPAQPPANRSDQLASPARSRSAPSYRRRQGSWVVPPPHTNRKHCPCRVQVMAESRGKA